MYFILKIKKFIKKIDFFSLFRNYLIDRTFTLYFVGASTSTKSPAVLPIKAFANEEVLDIFPEKGSASSEPTIDIVSNSIIVS